MYIYITVHTYVRYKRIHSHKQTHRSANTRQSSQSIAVNNSDERFPKGAVPPPPALRPRRFAVRLPWPPCPAMPRRRGTGPMPVHLFVFMHLNVAAR